MSGSSNRKFNVKLSAEACNGVILMPGEEFSCNNTTGSRSADKGYLPAPLLRRRLRGRDRRRHLPDLLHHLLRAVLHTTWRSWSATPMYSVATS